MRIRYVTPWYPDYLAVHSGIFVAKQVETVRQHGHHVVVDVPQIFPAPPGPIPNQVTEAMSKLAGRSIDAMFPRADLVTYVPTPVPSRGGPLGRARAVAQSLQLLSRFKDDDSDVVHAHVGLPAGWAVAQTIDRKPLVVTEHWSGLANALEEPVAAKAYSDLVRRADVFVCVSGHLRDQLVESLGSWARQRIEVIPNIVDLSDIPFRERPGPRLDSWVYVGGLMAHKGVQTLLKAFEEYTRRYSSGARLTLVGQGPLSRWIEMFASSKGLTESVSLAGSVEHSALGRYLDAADVMVHLSPAETFGIAPLEGIGAGLPVVSLRNDGAVNSWGEVEETCGLLLDLDSGPGEIADSIAGMRSDTERLDPVVGRRFVEERFSPMAVATLLTDVYERVSR